MEKKEKINPKHLIVAALVLATTALAVACIVLFTHYHKQSQTVQQLSQQLAEAEQQVADLSALQHTLYPDGEVPAYQSLYPNLYVTGSFEQQTITDKTAYLTFDDGPSQLTPAVLDVLNRYQVKATFFVVGRADEASKAIMQRIVQEGHTLGIHSFSHNYNQIYTSVESYLDDFNQIYSLIYESTGQQPRVFRFPGGSINSYNAAVYQEIVAEMIRRGFVYYDWNLSAEDAVSKKLSPQEIQNSILNGIRDKNRAFILMHDGANKNGTLAALPHVIEGVQQAGFTITPITDETKPMCFVYK